MARRALPLSLISLLIAPNEIIGRAKVDYGLVSLPILDVKYLVYDFWARENRQSESAAAALIRQRCRKILSYFFKNKFAQAVCFTKAERVNNYFTKLSMIFDKLKFSK